MTQSLEDLRETVGPLLRKHPEAVSVLEVVELQELCRRTLAWCNQLSIWNQRAEESLIEANVMLEAMLGDG